MLRLYAYQQWCAVRFSTSLRVILAECKLYTDRCAKFQPYRRCNVVILEKSPCPRGSSRTNLQVLVLGLQVLVLILVLKPQVLVFEPKSLTSLQHFCYVRMSVYVCLSLLFALCACVFGSQLWWVSAFTGSLSLWTFFTLANKLLLLLQKILL